MSQFSEKLTTYIKKSQQQLAENTTGRSAKDMAKNIFKRMAQKANSLLIIESRGFGIKAYVVERRGDEVELIGYADNNIMESSAALVDIVAQLKRDGCSVPTKALLVSGAVTSALLPLPIEGDRKLSDKQMQELVRWELEPLFTESIGHWTIGGLLIACGYLKEPERKQLLEELGEQKERMAGRGGRSPARFGELAIRAGFVTKEQLDECLSVHEKNQLADPTIDCSWSDESIASEDQGGLWLCSAINAQVRNEWLAVFSEHKIFLEGIYSQHHSAVTQLPEHKHEQLLLVINISLVTLIQVKNNHIVVSKQHRCSDYALEASDIIQLVSDYVADGAVDEETVEKVYYSGYHPRINDFVEELNDSLSCQFLNLDGVLDVNNVVNDPFSGDAAIMGAARHHFYKFSSQQLSSLHGTPPPPPWYKQPKLQVAAAVAVVILGISGNEAYYVYERVSTESEVQQNGLAVEKIDSINAKINSENTEYNRLMLEKKKLQEKLSMLSKRQSGLNTILLRRQQFLVDLLPLFSRSINDLIIIHRIDETSWYQFNVSGWSVDQLSIDEFNQKLTDELEAWDMQIVDNSSQEEKGYSGIDGYKFTMILESI